MNFRQVRKKIRTIGNVRKITKAMQMVAAVKMRKAQKFAIEGKPYQEILNKIIKRIVTPKILSSSRLLKKTEEQIVDKNLYILISSNKGLCGPFNFNLFKFLLTEADFQKDNFIVLGQKGASFILKMRGNIIANFSDQLPFIDNVSAIFSLVIDNLVNNKCQKVFLVYNKFFSTFKSESVKEQFLPIVDFKELDKLETRTEYLIEPSMEEIFDSLIRDYLQGRIRSAILDSEAAEHSARMMSMKNATDNADDIIYNLTLLRNRLRQQSITYELLDMVTAKEAAEGE
jgi:F-type H+-transporting ATPase subunit gamma